MKISRTHQNLSNYFNNPEVLTNPQLFLGPNWETVLRFWLYFESLTQEQKDELDRRYDAIDHDTRNRAWYLAYNAVVEVIGEDNNQAVWCAAPFLPLTRELTAMHLLFERGHSLTFVPLIKDL